jgi:hypothetical protein
MLLSVLIVILLGIPQPAIAQTPSSTFIYLPVVFNGNFSPPILISPANGAHLDTLIPTFVVDTSSSYPPGSSLCLALDTHPDPAPCWLYSGVSGAQYSFHFWDNLLPNQVYYWKVGINTEGGNPENAQVWSAEYSFVTGSSGTILSAPVPVSPANGSTVASNGLSLTWNAVPGAVEYAVFIGVLNSYSRTVYFSNSPQVQLPDLSPNTQYQWYVQARNSYAWGTASPTWNFTTSP